MKCRWLGWKDSNLRIAESKSAALPLGDTPSSRLQVVLRAGLEPARPEWARDFKSPASTIPPPKHKWCAKRDLNPHTFRHGLLRPACLPFHHSRKVWSWWSDLNRRPPTYKEGALPLSYTSKHGLSGRSRTCDPRLRRPMLYPAELLRDGSRGGARTHNPRLVRAMLCH